MSIFNLNDIRDIVHEMAIEKGWHDSERTFGEYIALMHSELSEALEEHRNGVGVTTVYSDVLEYDATNNGILSKPEGIPIELADVIIRILDFCGAYDIDIDEALRNKINYNMSRSHRHGNKVI